MEEETFDRRNRLQESVFRLARTFLLRGCFVPKPTEDPVATMPNGDAFTLLGL